MVKPDKCYDCGHPFLTSFDIFMLEAKMSRQTKLGSFAEAIANTALGFVISLVCMRIIMWAYGFPMGTRETGIVVMWMTVVSVLRGYVIRRMWNSQFWKRWHGNQS